MQLLNLNEITLVQKRIFSTSVSQWQSPNEGGAMIFFLSHLGGWGVRGGKGVYQNANVCKQRRGGGSHVNVNFRILIS